MKTKITAKIDDIEIIVGIGEPPVDPEATKNNALKLLADTDIVKSVTAKKCEYSAANDQRIAAITAARKKSISEREKNAANADYRDALALMAKINDELEELDKSLQSKYRELIIENQIYAIPASGETIISDDEADTITKKYEAAEKNGKRLKSDLTEISDYRGAICWECKNGVWQWRQIITIGDEPGKKEILQSDLTESQIKEIQSQMKK